MGSPWRVAASHAILVGLVPGPAPRAEPPAFTNREILGVSTGDGDGPRVESLRTRFTHFDQQGRGFQSQAGRLPGRPGAESLTVEQPQAELVVRSGRLTYRLWVPVDVVTAASPDATDAISSASRVNEAGALDLAARYRASPVTEITGRLAVHVEENVRSATLGAGGTRSFADGSTTLALSVHQVWDLMDTYTHRGGHTGTASRSSTNVNLGVTELLSPTTVAGLGYGGTLQLGQLSNTWNAVPLAAGGLADEALPSLRQRHALSARLAQALPWRGVIKGSYRFYADDWGIVAHSLEAQLYQRIGALAWARLNYRVHQQSAPWFWTAAAPADAALRTADSDLASFVAQTFGGMVAADIPLRSRAVHELHVDLAYDRYVRTNGLVMNVFSTGLGLRF